MGAALLGELNVGGDVDEILSGLKTKLAGFTPEQRSRVLWTLCGSDAVRAASILLVA
ncbi:hypothetical protein AB0I28_12550 [Phytomonospora sp. NPDC050363]|uniref:hypothetical protein n=1 Tax=Phytomonospora sp. NPDC050363 TaxID=3155642 RepID=UPI0033DFF70E